MSYNFYHVIHLVSVFVLVGSAIWAISNPSKAERKKVLMVSGISSLVTLIAAFGLLHVAGLGVPKWAIVKLAVWLGLSGIVGVAYRMPEQRKVLLFIVVGLVTIAILMVSLKPF